jgi:uncharacterized membrane protein YkvA (DUF1232 family)
MKSASRVKLAATVASAVRAATRPGAPSLPDRVQAVPRLVRSTIEGRYAGTTLKRLGLVAGAVAYIASPIDLLPEAVLPVVGSADDAVVIAWALKAFFDETDRFLAWESSQDRGRARPRRRSAAWTPAGGTSEASHTTVPGVPVDRSDEGADDTTTPPPSGARQAAADYLLERVRRRLER